MTHFRLVQVNEQLKGYLEDRLAQRLSARGFRVSTPADLEAVLGLERQRQLLGCEQDAACFAELSAALGVPLVLSGRLTRLVKRFELDVRVIRMRDARVVANDTRAVEDESELGAMVEACAVSLAAQLLPAEPARPVRRKVWGPVIGGLAAIAGGAALIGLTQVEYARWTTPGGSPGLLQDGQIATRHDALALQRGLGVGLAGLGAALIIAGIVWGALSPEPPVTLSLAPGPGGAGLTAGGRFAIIDRDGGVTEVASGAGLTLDAYLGLVGRRDGTIIGCPWQSRKVLVLTPNVRRTVSLRTMTSQWIDKF